MMERHPHEDQEDRARLVADLSHDLRTPLNAILGLTELMTIEAYGPMGDARYTGYARDIHEAGADLLHHINELLEHLQTAPTTAGHADGTTAAP